MCCLIMASSCKKSSTDVTIPPGNPNNEIKGAVSVKGSAVSSFTATGNSTVFVKRFDPNGDTVIVITGPLGEGQVEITLVNTNSAGTYAFENNPSSRVYSLCWYGIGNALTGPFELYIATTGNDPGTVTIENLTSNSIKGSFTSNCVGSDGIIQITNGSFKGEF